MACDIDCQIMDRPFWTSEEIKNWWVGRRHPSHTLVNHGVVIYHIQHLATSTTSLTNFTTKPQASTTAWQKFNLKRFPSLWIFFMFPASDRTEACHSLGGLYSQILQGPNKGIGKQGEKKTQSQQIGQPTWLLFETHIWLLFIKLNDLFSKEYDLVLEGRWYFPSSSKVQN